MRGPRWLSPPGTRTWALVCVIVALALLGRRVQADGPSGEALVIGSKNFTESRLLAEIMAQLVEAQTGAVVERRTNLGGTQLVFSALVSGRIDAYPEYTGTAWTILLDHEERIVDPLKTYLVSGQQLEQRHAVRWAMPFGFENAYALALREQQAEALDVSTISGLLPHADALVAGFSHEFLHRADGYPGLQQHYGLELSTVRGMEHGLAYEAIASGRTDLIDTYTTDAKLRRFPVRLLEDDRHFFPPYDAAPLVRADLATRHPEALEALQHLAFRIDDAKMRELNFEVEERGRSVPQVAAMFLQQQGLLEEGESQSRVPSRDGSLWVRMWRSRAMLLDRGLEHVVLTTIAVLAATLFAIPLGIVLTRVEWLRGTVLGAAGVIQTIPSLALLAFMIPVPGLGLGARSAVVALFLYALLPIVRNTYAGIKDVDADLIDAARGMGLTDRQILRHVEMPLATRTIMAGVRTSTVISIGVATLAAFIGAGGLGDPIITGLQLNDSTLILLGALPAAALAVVADFVLGRIEARLSPPGS